MRVGGRSHRRHRECLAAFVGRSGRVVGRQIAGRERQRGARGGALRIIHRRRRIIDLGHSNRDGRGVRVPGAVVDAEGEGVGAVEVRNRRVGAGRAGSRQVTVRRRAHDCPRHRPVGRTDGVHRDRLGRILGRTDRLVSRARRIRSVDARLDAVLNRVRHVREEVVAGQRLDLFHADDVGMPIGVDRLRVGHDDGQRAG